MRRLLVAMCLVFAVGVAHADDKAKAKALYDEGLRHYNVAEYTQAIDAWKQAYLLSKKPLLLFNIAQAYRLSGDCAQALTFYDSYTRDEPDLHNQDELDQAVAACKNPAKPPDKPQDVTTGTTVHPEQPAETPKTTAERANPSVQPPPTEATDTTQTEHWSRMRKLGIGVGVAGVVAGGVGLLFAHKGSTLASENQNTPAWDPIAKSRENDGKRANTLAWAFGGTGLALAIAGGVMFALGGHSQEHAVALAPTSGGATVAWGFRF